MSIAKWTHTPVQVRQVGMQAWRFVRQDRLALQEHLLQFLVSCVVVLTKPGK